MATAAGQVLDIIELLECVLLNLPTQDLLFAQQVSKQWHMTIASSRKLQQALFFEPIPGGPLYCHLPDNRLRMDLITLVA